MLIKVQGRFILLDYYFLDELSKITPQPVLKREGSGPLSTFFLPHIVVSKKFKIEYDESKEPSLYLENIKVIKDTTKPFWTVDVLDIFELTERYPEVFKPIEKLVEKRKLRVERNHVVTRCEGTKLWGIGCVSGFVLSPPSGYFEDLVRSGKALVEGYTFVKFVPVISDVR